MRKESIKEMTMESFHQYGTFANMLDPKGTKIGEEPIEFFRDMVQLDLGGKSIASFSVCRVVKRPAVVDVTEFHSSCGEVVLPVDGHTVMHVGAATPGGEVPLDEIEIFRVPKGMLVSLRPGVWHHAPFADGCDSVNVIVALPERTYANDCEVYDIPEEDPIEIEGM